MKVPCLLQPRVLKLALKSLFSRPHTTDFPAGEYSPVPQFRGRPRFDEATCIGCGACAEVCPAKCIEVTDDLAASPPVRRLVQRVDICIWCGQCERYCTSETGIRMTSEYDCAALEQSAFEEVCAKELLLCEVCGAVIAPLDHIRWLATRLGPLAYTNPTVLLVSQQELGIVAPPLASEGSGIVRGDRLKIVCPKCRRETAFVA